VLASLIGYFGDFDLAEEAAAEAFAVAAQRWPSAGVPDNPGAWLVITARHRAIDRLRRDRVLAAKLPLLAPEPRTEEPAEEAMAGLPIPDERLELVFLCCHPALAIEAQVALTLRAVAGLSTEEIARAFLVPAETMKRRLTRAKSKIKVAGIPFGVPAASQLPERLGAVLAVVYLIFNEGYGGQPGPPGLAAEAIRLGRVLAALLPAEPEVLGLLALMLLHDARREARFDGQDLVCCCRTRTGRGGTGRRSPRPGTSSTTPCSTRRCSKNKLRAARTPCRPRSPLCSSRSGSTGCRSPRSTPNSPTGPARP